LAAPAIESRRGSALNDAVTPGSYWYEPVDGLLAAVHSTSDGLSAAEAGQRLAQVGPNVLEVRKKATALGLFLNQFKSPILLILLGATGVSAAVRDWVDAAIILAIVLAAGVVAALVIVVLSYYAWGFISGEVHLRWD